MALISCPECNNEISDKAASCPKCGIPLSKTRTTKTGRAGTPWEAIGFLLITGGVIYGIATPPDNHIGGTIGVIGFIIFIIGRFK